MSAPRMRRVALFNDKAYALLSAEDWAGATVHVDSGRAWLDRGSNGRVFVMLDEYDLRSADPARVREEAVSKLRRQARDPRYTDASKAADARFADELEAVTR